MLFTFVFVHLYYFMVLSLMQRLFLLFFISIDCMYYIVYTYFVCLATDDGHYLGSVGNILKLYIYNMCQEFLSVVMCKYRDFLDITLLIIPNSVSFIN